MKNLSFTTGSIPVRTGNGYSAIFTNKWFSLLLLVLFAAGCKKVIEETGITSVCPVVISTSPVDTATRISLGKRVDATFNKAMNPASLTSATFSVRQGSIVLPGTVTYAGTMASFTPTVEFQPNTLYTGMITTGVQDTEGNAMLDNYAWSFTTGDAPDTTAPTVTATDPVHDARAVLINKKISVVFSEPMDPLTISTISFTISNTSLSGTLITGSVLSTSTTAEFTPSADLLPNTTYEGNITTTAKDLAGNSISSIYVWNFTTAAVDVILPTVVSTDPENLATGVAPDKQVSATFSHAMDPSTINTTTFTVTQGLTVISGLVSYSGTTATFTPSNNLAPNTTYTGTISTGAKDMAGNSLASSYIWNFTTAAAPVVIPPIVTSTDPDNLATGVAYDKIITATFSKAMDPSTITTTTFTITQGLAVVSGLVSYSGTTATFTPSANLAPNTTYTGTISAGAKDMAGNSLASNYTWNFTTAAAPVVIPPIVTSTDPDNLATGVALDKIITATFSKAMDPSTITTTTFTITQGLTVISGLVSYSGTTATFTPSANLAPNTTYTGTISAGAKDMAGNSLATNYVWSFTTGAAPDVTPPTVISTDPANLATGVALDKMITASFSEAMNSSTITTTSFTVQTGGSPVSGTVVYTGTTATFSPSANLAPNTTYTATITTAAQDLAGNPLVTNYAWSFTTGVAPDVTRPTVIITDPVNGATNVDPDKKISAGFSEAMDPMTINATSFLLTQGGTAVFGIVTYTGTTATFSPAADLASNTMYTATITTLAKDLSGNAIQNNYVWTFTTKEVVLPPSLGTASMFGAFGGAAGITNQGINTVINNGSIGTIGASTLITGFHDGTTGDVYTETPLNKGDVKGRIYTAPPFPGTETSFAVATQAALDATIAYNSISPASKPGGTDPGAGELGGLTLAPGIYKSASGTFNISNGDLTLDAQGDPNAVWIFQTAAGLTVGIAGPTGARSVRMINGGLPKNVFWHVGSAATINGAGGGIMVGNIIASAGVTFSTADNMVQTVLNGRALSLNASVTMVNTTINVP